METIRPSLKHVSYGWVGVQLSQSSIGLWDAMIGRDVKSHLIQLFK